VAPTCASVRERLEPLVDGLLDEAGAAALDAHLRVCPDCRAHHAEAASLPLRLAAVPAPEPPAALVAGVLRRVAGERVDPVRLWVPLAVELALALVALWYVSGPQGLVMLAQRTAADVGSVVGWGLGVADLPDPGDGDVFLLVLCGLLLATTIYHLALLFRQGRPVTA
jgi:predicted anti-sigma-YlaC factor YlaD